MVPKIRVLILLWDRKKEVSVTSIVEFHEIDNGRDEYLNRLVLEFLSTKYPLEEFSFKGWAQIYNNEGFEFERICSEGYPNIYIDPFHPLHRVNVGVTGDPD